MATTYRITRVRTERAYDAAHEHISMVEIDDAAKLTRDTVIRDLRSPWGDRYYTYGGGLYADVIVAGCPHCYASDYITTAPDSTTENNLLELPRF